ncbi:MAG: nitrilase, partial [Caldilineaceae bacterium]|nr:nitrilase [Caldilineaceae bacterium]
MTKIRAAVVQNAPVAFDTGATMTKVATLVAQAATQGAQLAVFPEAFVGG